MVAMTAFRKLLIVSCIALVVLLDQTSAVAEGKVWAFFVGIKDYPGSIGRLYYPVEDASALYRMFRNFNGVEAELLTDAQDTTKAKIESRLKSFVRRAPESDTVIFVFCGHGCSLKAADQSERKDNYLLPIDAVGNRPETWLKLSELFSIAKAGHKNVVFFLDACRNTLPTVTANGTSSADLGGNSGNGGMVFRQGEVGGAKFLVDTGAFTYSESPPEGVAVCCSCKSGQSALEHSTIGHGVFTYYLLKAFSGDGDFDGNGKLQLTEVEQYLDKHVPIYVRELRDSLPVTDVLRRTLEQNPMMLKNSSNPVLMDFSKRENLNTRFRGKKLYQDAEFLALIRNKAERIFSHEDLTGADLRGLDLSGAQFEEAKLDRANLSSTNLRGANFKGASLVGVTLTDADLKGADLLGANLIDSDCRRANFSGTTKAGLVSVRNNFDGAKAPPVSR